MKRSLRSRFNDPCGAVWLRCSHTRDAQSRRSKIKICEFISAHRETILADWEEFADALTPDRPELTRAELRDFAGELLDSIVDALAAPDAGATVDGGDDPAVLSAEVEDSAEAHASHRLKQRFTLKQMVAEYRGLRASVSRRWIDSLAHVERAHLEELLRFGRTVDMSLAVSVARYHDRLRKAQDELRAADHAKDEFLTVLGHELRNPLAPLRTGLDLLARTRAKPELLDSVRPMMERQFSHLVRLVDDLLDLARISRGEINLQPAPLDLNAVIEAALEQLAPAIAERRHELHVQLADRPLPLVGDFERLTQVVANVLSNACKYTAPGGRIAVRSRAHDGQAIVTVRDTGYGIPAGRLESIFDFLSQVPEHRALTGGGGLGVGLPLSRRIVDMHQGAIEASSGGLGEGSEFRVRLPLGRVRPEEQTAGGAAGAPGPVRRVLVVDDNRDSADSLCVMLEQWGHVAQAAYDGPTALHHVEHFAPHVVLLDLGLPGMDGLEVCRRVRALPGGADLLLVAVTGWGGQGSYGPRTREAGFDEHLVKPLEAAQIRQILASLT